MADKADKKLTLLYCAIAGLTAAVTVPVAKNAQREYATAKADYVLAEKCVKKAQTGNACTDAETAALDATRERQKKNAHFWVFPQRGL